MTLQKQQETIKDYLPAGFWIRLGAFWLDLLIILFFAMFLGSLLYSTVLGQSLFPSAKKAVLFLLILFILYHAFFLKIFKKTPGKRYFELELTPNISSMDIGYGETFLRTLSYFISGICFGIGFFWIAFDKNKQGWHDKIAKTRVIRKSKLMIGRRITTLAITTFILIILIILQFNLARIYKFVFHPDHGLSFSNGKEIVTVLITKNEIKNGVFKEVDTRKGPHAIRIPPSAEDGDIFKVNRSEEEGGVFFIRIIIIESI